MRTEPQAVDNETHILIGVRANGVMPVIADWPHVPKQAGVQKGNDTVRDGYWHSCCARRPRSYRQAGMGTPGQSDYLDFIGAGDQLNWASPARHFSVTLQRRHKRSPTQALGNGVLQIRHRRVLASGPGSVSSF
jgi:hypothetical protein